MTANLETDLVVRDLVAEDIPQLLALFEACYGRTYTNPIFYDESALREAIASGRLRPVVVEWRGRIAGHMALTIRHPNARVCEAGNTVVHPDARGRGLMPRLAHALHERTRRDGFSGYIHYPTTAHDIMQRASVLNGGVETGIMLGYVPVDTKYERFAPSQSRLAVTVAFQPMESLPPRTLARMPHRYAGLLTDLYTRCEMTRTVSGEAGSISNASRITTAFNARRDALQVDVHSIGNDIEAEFEALFKQVDAAAVYADLPVDAPGIDRAIDALRKHGFFFAALLPEFANTDVLRLQHIRDRSENLLNPPLTNEGAKKLLEVIHEDVPR